MKILISSHRFHPDIGGTEEVSSLLATEFVRKGHEVKLVTATRGQNERAYPFKVIRQPSLFTLCQLIHWCDIYFQNNISLRTIWPLFFLRRPGFVAHHTPIEGLNSPLKKFLKQRVARLVRNIAVSRSMAKELAAPATVIANPFRSSLFSRDSSIARHTELIYVGRFVSVKGIDLLIEAMGLLKTQNVRPKLTLVGDGPEKEVLIALAGKQGVKDQLTFSGIQTGADLVRLYNRHRIVVVPSRCEESFGLVAIEAMACGCRVIATRAGGLPETVGALGRIIEPENSRSLAQAINEMLKEDFDWEEYWKRTDHYVDQFKPDKVAERYLRLFSEATTGS